MRIFRLLAIPTVMSAVLLVMLPLTPANAADDPVTTAVQKFKGGDHVYVDPSAEVSFDPGKVRDAISSAGLSMYVAVLPDSTGTPEDVVRRIGQNLGGRVTVAVLVGTHFRAGSSALAKGEAGRLADQAFAEGRPDITKTLTIFAGKVKTASVTRKSLVPVRTSSHALGGVVTVLVVVLLLALLGGLGMAFFLRRGRRGRLDRVRAEAQRWYERLGGEVLNLSARDNDSARQALADASERYTAAGSALSGASTEADYRSARDTALEGLHYARAARTALGIDPGPELPPTSTQEAAGRIHQEQSVDIGGQQVSMRPDYAPNAPYYYPGGIVGGGRVPGGWYSQPFWKTALIGGAAGLGGLLVADALFDAVRGPFWGGYGGGMFGGGWGGGYGGGYGGGSDSGANAGGDSFGGDFGGEDFGGGGDFGGGDFGGGGDGGGGDF